MPLNVFGITIQLERQLTVFGITIQLDGYAIECLRRKHLTVVGIDIQLGWLCR
jgi:hypothetical protein